MFLSILAEMDFCSSLRVFSWGEKNQMEGWNVFFLLLILNCLRRDWDVLVQSVIYCNIFIIKT